MTENTDYGRPAAADERASAGGGRYQASSNTTIELGTEDFVPDTQPRIWRARNHRMPFTCASHWRDFGFKLNQQMAELGIAPTNDTICIAESFAGDSEQFWAAVPDGNYCVFTRVGATPALFGEIAEELNANYTEKWGGVAPSFAMEPLRQCTSAGTCHGPRRYLY